VIDILGHDPMAFFLHSKYQDKFLTTSTPGFQHQVYMCTSEIVVYFTWLFCFLKACLGMNANPTVIVLTQLGLFIRHTA
jgi:hypothetical protein